MTPQLLDGREALLKDLMRYRTMVAKAAAGTPSYDDLSLDGRVLILDKAIAALSATRTPEIITDELVERACAAFYPSWTTYSSGYRAAKHTRWARALRAVFGKDPVATI